MVGIVNQLLMVPIAEIRPYEQNPRINEDTISRLVELIPRVGFNVPLVLDRSNIIVKGHSRFAAAQRLGMPALPCVYSDADEETIRLDRLADNRVQEFSSWDKEMLASELGALNLDYDFDLAMLDFTAAAPRFDGPAPTAPTAFPDAEDLEAVAAATRVPVADPEYLEVVCTGCGNHVFVKTG